MARAKKEKSVVGKAVDAVKQLAATVSEAAHKAIESKPAPSEDEVIVVPAAPTGFMDEAVTPQPIVVRKRRKPRQNRARATRPGRTTAKKRTSKAKAAAPRKATKKTARKSAARSRGARR
jgi:hypothetical protein